MNLQGKKINFLGDSITEGHGTSAAERQFTSLIAAQYGAVSRCYGIGGTRIARQHTPSANPRHDLDFPSRVAEMDADADLIAVFGGTNDFGHGDAPIGTFDDRDPSTFCGACHFLMSGLIARYCGKPIVIVTPLHRLCEEDPEGDGTGRKLDVRAVLADYRTILMETAGYYGLPVLDLYATSGMQPRHPVARARLMPDGLHPSDEGHAIIARRIGEFLKTL